MDIRENIVDAIGNTPIVRLGRVHPPGNLVAKVEYMNPGGSSKDRIGLAMIERAERNGWLQPGGTIVEPTSGNTGVGSRHGRSPAGLQAGCRHGGQAVEGEAGLCCAPTAPRSWSALPTLNPRIPSRTTRWPLDSRVRFPVRITPISTPTRPTPKPNTTPPARDLAANRRRDRHLRRRSRHRRNHLGCRQVPEGAEPRGSGRRRRSRGLDLHGSHRGGCHHIPHRRCW